VEVDLDIDGISDSDEEDPAQYLALNDDDDDNNDTIDKNDSSIPGGDDEMVSLSLSFEPDSMSTGVINLSGSSKVKVWENPTKGTEVTLPKQWDLSSDTVPSNLYVEGVQASSSLKDIELKLSYISGSTICDDKVKITVIDVDYTEDTSQTYGYDSYTDSPTIDYFPYKSVKVGDSDTAYADSSMASGVYFTSSNTGNVTVSPSQASSTHQQVTFQGVSEGFAQGLAELYDPAAYDIIAAAIGVYAYNPDSYKVAIRVIHEDDDDVQEIDKYKGKPNQVAIAPGSNMILDTTTTSGDDTIVVSNVLTGPDGICQTTAQGDDYPVIPVGQGKPDTICVSVGDNGKLDTNKSGNDEYFGDNISTGWDGICDTTADNIDDPSTDPFSNPVTLQNFLNNNIYHQAVVVWTVTKITATAVNWDLDRDGELDVAQSGWSSEEEVIINNCDPGGSHDVIVYYVDNPDKSYCGRAQKPGTFCFVYPDKSPDENITTSHELGHAKFALDDLEPPSSSDSENIMWHQFDANKWRLRKNQWETIH
jgi:hypothetical protein